MKRLLFLTAILPLILTANWRQSDDALRPQVIDIYPSTGMELLPGEAISLTFNQVMNQNSVEQSLQFIPDMEGVFEWETEQLVQFFPHDLEQGQHYAGVLGTDARAAKGLSLEYPFRFEIQAIQPLAVGDVAPLPDSVDVDIDSQLVISFNRPVVPLVSTDQLDDFDSPISIVPAVEGVGQWVNTSLYMFTPSRPLNGGATYTVTVSAGLTSVDGAFLPENFTWHFQTMGPKVLNCHPLSGNDGLPLDRPVVVVFNQAMDEASTEAAFRLFPEDDAQTPVTGVFIWDETHTILTFQPAQRLQIDTYYQVMVELGALNASRDTALLEPFSTRFYTVPWPRVSPPITPDVQVDGVTVRFISPMNMNSLRDHIRIEPEPDEWWPEVWHDNRVHLAFSPSPDTTYTVMVLAGAEDVYGNPIIEDYTLSVHFDPVRSNYVSTYRGGTVLLDPSQPDTTIDATVRGHAEATFVLYRLDSPFFKPDDGIYFWYSGKKYPRPATSTLVHAWRQSLASKSVYNEQVPIFLKSESGGQLPLGLYQLNYDFVTADHPEQGPWEHGAFNVVVANVNLTLKRTPQDMFIWVTDLLTGEPRADVPVTLYNRGEVIGQGRSDADGILRLSLDVLPEISVKDEAVDWSLWSVWAVAEDDDIFGYWQSPWPTGSESETLFLYTDRSIYRPGETVYFRGVLRNRYDMTYNIPSLSALHVVSQIYQPKEGTYQLMILFDQEVAVTSFGTFSGEFTIPDDAPLGSASLFTSYDEPREYSGTSLSFTIAEYRVPEYHVSVTPEQTEIVQGEPVRAVVEAAYYAGGAVSDTSLGWIAVGNPAYFPYRGPGRYRFVDYDVRPSGTWNGVYQPTLLTDEDGQYQIDFDLNEQFIPYPMVIDIQATVSDETNQKVTARSSVLVHPADVYVGLRANTYFGRENQPITVDAIAVTPQSGFIAHQSITLSAVEIRWKRQEIPDEWGRYTWEREDIAVDRLVTETDQNGSVTYSFTPPRAGVYQVRAEAVDSAGRLNRSSIRMWVQGQNRLQWGAQKNHQVTMIPDQDSYRPGDTAQVIIPVPFMDEGQTTVLVTVERGDIFSYEVFQVDGPAGSILYELPITAAHAPDVYVSALMVQSASAGDPFPDYRQGSIRLDVEPVDRLLTVTLTPDQTAYHPRDEATFDVLVTDSEDQPVPNVEVGLNLTDRAVLDLVPYSARYGGGCGTPPRFAPLEEPISPIVAAFYSPQRNAVRTDLSLPALVGVDRTEGDPGGGCGGGGGSPFVTPTIRTDFKTTPLWEAHLVTDESGHTQARVTLPDNLTTWQLNAVAITADTRVGQAKIELVSSLPLRVSAVAPRFFVVGDQVDLGAMVHNATETAQVVDVFLAAEGVVIESPNPQTITLSPESRAAVFWRVRVDDVPGVDLTVSVISESGLSDAAKPSLTTGINNSIPVYRYSATDTIGTAGLLMGAEMRVEGISLPPHFDPDYSELSVELSSSLVGPIMDGLAYLEIYPHYCIEQTVSRFLPNVVTYRALQAMGLDDDELEAGLERNFRLAMSKLQAAQNDDGGWGWFDSMSSDPMVTAYVVFGLTEARRAGLEVDETMFQNGLSVLSQGVDQPLPENISRWQLNRRAFEHYVLSHAGLGDPDQLNLLFEQHEYMSYEGYAYLLMAYAEDDPEAPAAKTLFSDLISGATFSAAGVHWEETTWHTWGSATRTTALVLSALARYQPDHELLPNVVRWLIIARQGKHWSSTQETTWAIIGLTDWMAYTGELAGNYSYRVSLNHEPITERQVTPDTARESETLRIAVRDLLAGELNRLSLSRGDGEGVLYYSAFLSLKVPLPDVRATSRGLSISREYFLNNDHDEPVTQAKVGDIVAVRLTITTSQDLYYAVIEDPLPAGLEVLNRRLAITPDVVQQSSHSGPAWYWGWRWFDQTEIRDAQINLYADFLPRGTYVYTYYAQATLSGEFQVIPARGYAFYQPDISGRTDSLTFTVFRDQQGEQ